MNNSPVKTSEQATPTFGAAGLTHRPSLRRYLMLYALAYFAIAAVWGGPITLLVPLHLQQIEFLRYFTDADAGVDLKSLTDLRTLVGSGKVVATAEQRRLLTILADFDAARAAKLSIVTSVGVLVTMLVQPLVGILSDRTRSIYGRRAPWILGGAVVTAIGLFGFSAAASVPALAVAWAVVSVASNTAAGPLNATIADRVPNQQVGVASALSGLGGILGLVLGSVAAGALFVGGGVTAYLPFAALALLLPALFVFVVRDRSSTGMRIEPLSARSYMRAFTIALRDRDFRWVWIAKVCLLFGYSVSSTLMVYMLQSYIHPALSPDRAARIAPLLLLAALPGTLLSMAVAGRWSDKLGRRKPFVIGSSFLFAISMLIPLLWPSLPALVIQVVIAGVALGAFMATDQALLIDVLPDRDAAGRDLGIGNLGGNLGQALGPIVAGAIVAATGSYRMIWVVAAVLVLIAAVAIIPVKRAR